MIVIGPEIFHAQDRGGISRGFAELFSEAVRAQFNWSLWISTDNNIHLREVLRSEEFRRNIHGPGLRGRSIDKLGYFNFRRSGFRAYCRNNDPAVVHHSYYSAFDYTGTKMKHVETLHDLCDENFSADYDVKQKIRSMVKFSALERADAIVCVSQATKNALQDYRPNLASKAIVIHHGIQVQSFSSCTRPSTRPYFLFVGKRDGYKNFCTIARALKQSTTLKNHTLVCFGGGPATKSEMRLLVDLGIAERFMFERGNDEALNTCYQQAVALLYPSFYEGFGLPLLEAMTNNCPVISSNTTSLPEIGASAAMYVAPGDTDAWQHAMEEVAEKTTLRQSMIAKGVERVKDFSWKKAVSLHNDLYASL